MICFSSLISFIKYYWSLNWKLIVKFTEFPKSHGKRVIYPNVIGHRGHFIMGLQDGLPLSVNCVCMLSESPTTMLCPWWKKIKFIDVSSLEFLHPVLVSCAHTLRSTTKQHIRYLTMFVLDGLSVWFGPLTLVLPLRLTRDCSIPSPNISVSKEINCM